MAEEFSKQISSYDPDSGIALGKAGIGRPVQDMAFGLFEVAVQQEP